MAREFHPDDSFLEKGRQTGIDQINDALKKFGFDTDRDRILTSRDPRMDQVRNALMRQNMPPGWQSWQVPAYLASKYSFFFLQVAQPGAVLPEHGHEVDQFRMVLSGGVIYNGVELKSGDWMFIPKGKEYGLSISTNPGPAVITYAY
jgi:hypothetical protein